MIFREREKERKNDTIISSSYNLLVKANNNNECYTVWMFVICKSN